MKADVNLSAEDAVVSVDLQGVIGSAVCVVMNYRKVIRSVCISLLFKDNNVMNVKFIY